MIYNKKIIKAINMAYDAHKYQYDKIGVPYIFHPFKVAESIIEEESQFGGIKDCEALENCIIIALLHDVLETKMNEYSGKDEFVQIHDGFYKCFGTKEEMVLFILRHIRIEFGDIVANGVETITRKDGETYSDYIDRVCTNPYAVKVKIHDIKNNMNVNRMKLLDDKDKDSLSKRYMKAIEKLVKYERL